jgi:serine/threonine-protein kinase HipA
MTTETAAVPDLAVLEVRLHERTIGTLTRLPGDRNVFAFTQDYIADPARPTLSLSFKDAFGDLITDIGSTQTRLPPLFSNLLPEGALRDYLAARARVKSMREFFLAWVLGRDLPGALTIVSAERDALPAADDDLPAPTERPASDDSALRFSLAGVQLKFSAVKKAPGGLTIPVDGAGGSWIVKLPSTRFAGVPENEFGMMELARRIGIDVPETKLVPVREITGLPSDIDLAGDTAYAIRRFDRADDGQAIHMEDFAQVFGVYPEKKYEKASYRNIARVLWIETGASGVVEFLRRFVMNALIGNADMHLKNWSLLYPDRRTARLSPAYDFVSTIAYLREDALALTFVDSKAFQSLDRDRFVRFAARAGLPEKLTLDTVYETATTFAEVWRSADDLPIANATRQVIDAHLRTMPLWIEVAGR